MKIHFLLSLTLLLSSIIYGQQRNDLIDVLSWDSTPNTVRTVLNEMNEQILGTNYLIEETKVKPHLYQITYRPDPRDWSKEDIAMLDSYELLFYKELEYQQWGLFTIKRYTPYSQFKDTVRFARSVGTEYYVGPNEGHYKFYMDLNDQLLDIIRRPALRGEGAKTVEIFSPSHK